MTKTVKTCHVKLNRSRAHPLRSVIWFVAFTVATSTPPSFAQTPHAPALPRLAASSSEGSSAERIALLQQARELDSDSEPEFIDALEEFLAQGQIAAAKEYFHEYSQQPRARRNAFWMLAKLACAENDSAAARVHFAQALQADLLAPSITLLRDYFSFRRRQHGTLNVTHEVLELKLAPSQHRLARALLHFTNGDFARAQQEFARLVLPAEHEAMRFELWGESVLRNEFLSWARRHDWADSIWSVGLSLASTQADVIWQARFHLLLAHVAKKRWDIRKLAAHCDSAEARIKRSASHALRPSLLKERGDLAYLKHQYHNADSLYTAAVAVAQKLRSHSALAEIYLNRSYPRYVRSEFQTALSDLDSSENFARAQRDEATLALMRLQRARVYVALARNDEADALLQQVRDHALRRKSEDLLQRVKVVAADLQHARGRHAEARAGYELFLAYLKRLGNTFEAHNYMARIADTFKREDSLADARTWYLRALRSAEQAGASSFRFWNLIELTQLELTLGNFDSTLLFLNELYPQALKTEDQGLIQSLCRGYGIAYKGLRQYQHAAFWYRRAAAMIERERESLRAEGLRLGYFAERAEVYHELAECYFYLQQTGGPPGALDSVFHFMQMAQSRTLQEALSGRWRARALTADSSYHHYQRATQRLRLVQRRLRRNSQRDSVAAMLAEWHAAKQEVITQRLRISSYDFMASDTLTVTRHELGATLRSHDSAFLLYHIGLDTAFVLIATKEKLAAVPLPEKWAVLDSLVHALLQPLHEATRETIPQLRFQAALAYELYTILLAPVLETLHASQFAPRHFIIVPGTALSDLPFEMLLKHKPVRSSYLPSDEPDYARSFVVQAYDFSYSPSVALLRGNFSAHHAASGILVMANATAQAAAPVSVASARTGWNFSPLPHAELESEQLKERYAEIDTCHRDNATKAFLYQRASSQRILHFATHAFTDSVFDAFSGLVLALSEEATDDGLLLGYEIAEMNLASELVILSACETGAGEPVRGEGVLGLPRLFLRAGAKSVLMTHWQVDDRFAAALTPKFYEAYLRQARTQREALADAKRTAMTLKSPNANLHYAHPFYWAAFTLYGNGALKYHTQDFASEPLRLLALIAALLVSGYLFLRRLVRRF